MTREGEKVVLRGGRSRFSLSSLPASEFPVIEDINAQHTLRIRAHDCRRLIDKTHFAMAQQDVRYYLNGTLLETDGKALRAVATDGHRLSWCEVQLEGKARELQQIILPRKGVLELQRLLDGEGEIEIAIGTNHIRVQIGEVRFTSKLIDGKFPEYGRVIPSQPPRVMTAPAGGDARGAAADRDPLEREVPRRAPDLCARAADGAGAQSRAGRSRGSARGRVQRARRSRSASTSATCSMRWRRSRPRRVEVGLTDANSSCLIRTPGDSTVKYVVMPMRL